MDLFKSIFASDEELDDNEEDIGDDVESGVATRASALPAPEPSRDVNPEENPSSPTATPKPSLPDLSVHQLFKHLFDPQMDNGRLSFHSAIVFADRIVHFIFAIHHVQ